MGSSAGGREQEVREFGPELWKTFVNRSTENSTELIAISRGGYCGLVHSTRQGAKNAAVRYVGPLKDQADKSNYRQGISSSLGGIEFNHSKMNPDFAETSFATQQGVRMVRLNPDSLREPSGLIPQDELIQLKSEHGVGLAGVYDAIRDRDVDTFIGIQEQIRKLFDGVDKLQLKVRNPGLNNGDFENVRRLALKARESGCNAVVFLRDRDRQRQREKVIERAANDCSRWTWHDVKLSRKKSCNLRYLPPFPL